MVDRPRRPDSLIGIRSIVSQFQRACKKPAIVALLFLAVFGTTSVVVVAVKYRHSIFAQRAAAVAVAEERSSSDSAPTLLPLASVGGDVAVRAAAVTVKPVPTAKTATKKKVTLASSSSKDTEADPLKETVKVKSGVSNGYYTMPAAGKNWGILHGHNGVDIANKCGTAVNAAADGIVASVGQGWNGGYGTDVVLKHDNGTETLYAHLQAASVSQGDEVKQGALLGQMGKTGKATGCHLHVEVHGAKNPFAFK